MGRFDRADLWHRDEQVEYLGRGEVAGAGGEDLLEADRALTQILFEFRPQASNLVGLPERVHPALGGARRGDRRGAAVGLVRLPERVERTRDEVALVVGGGRSGFPRGIAPPIQVG